MALLSFNKKLSTLALVVAGFISTSTVAAELEKTKLERLERDMKIMRNILQTSLQKDRSNQPRIESVYLAGQGMLFNIEARGGFSFEFHNMNLSEFYVPEIKAVAPVASVDITPEAMERFEEHAMEAAESAMEAAEMAIDQLGEVSWSGYSNKERVEHRNEQRKLRDEHRALERESRILERDVRDIERKIRDAEFEDQIRENKQETEKVKKLKDELSALTNNMSKIANELQKKSQVMQQRAEEIKKKQIEKQLKELAETEQAIAQTVCDFGSGLRSLPNNQYMTFNVQGKESKLYVFSKNDIAKCGDGKISSSKMLENATKYSM